MNTSLMNYKSGRPDYSSFTANTIYHYGLRLAVRRALCQRSEGPGRAAPVKLDSLLRGSLSSLLSAASAHGFVPDSLTRTEE